MCQHLQLFCSFCFPILDARQFSFWLFTNYFQKYANGIYFYYNFFLALCVRRRNAHLCAHRHANRVKLFPQLVFTHSSDSSTKTAFGCALVGRKLTPGSTTPRTTALMKSRLISCQLNFRADARERDVGGSRGARRRSLLARIAAAFQVFLAGFVRECMRVRCASKTTCLRVYCVVPLALPSAAQRRGERAERFRFLLRLLLFCLYVKWYRVSRLRKRPSLLFPASQFRIILASGECAAASALCTPRAHSRVFLYAPQQLQFPECKVECD